MHGNVPNGIKKEKCANIIYKAKKLNLPIPNGVWILPTNFEQLSGIDNVAYRSDYDLLTKLFRQNNIPYSLLEKTKSSYPKLVQHSFEFVELPLIVFTMELLKNNPNILLEALKPVYKFLKKRTRNDPEQDKYTVNIQIIKEIKNQVCYKYQYKGSLNGLSDFFQFVKDDNIEQ